MNELEKFHDATFLGCELDWSSGELVVRLKIHTGEKNFHCQAVKDFSITRQEEWGPSVSVNSVSISDNDNLMELTIEIQSGDLLKCRCEKVKEA